MIEAPGPDLLAGEVRMEHLRVAMTCEAEQRRAANDIETARERRTASRLLVCRLSFVRVASIHWRSDSALRPTTSAGPDTGQGPSAAAISAAISLRAIAKPSRQTSKTKEFTERAQHDDREFATKLDHAALRSDIGEGFIDDQAAAAPVRAGARPHRQSRRAA